jgi:hypothetical protein
MNCQFYIKPKKSRAATPISACPNSMGKKGKNINDTLIFFAKARYPSIPNIVPLAPTLATYEFILYLKARDPKEENIPAER